MEGEVSHQRPLPPTSGAAALAPGFRFHPTDEELVSFYLKRKICQKPFRFDPIAEIDIYKSEPWDLPTQSRLKSRDLEWYFFSGLDKKYGNGSKTNRATEQGYWKTTGKDRAVRRRSRTVGMKKTLVYHIGRAPRGQRTNWVMHEYRLVDEELEQAGVAQDAFVLCRIFQKSGSGPKNGEQYGAPFMEEEWDEEVLMPKKEDASDSFFDIGDVGYVQQNGLDQDIDTATSSENVPLPSSFYYEDTRNPVEDARGYEDDKTVFIGQSERDGEPLFDIQEFFNLPGSCEIEQAEVKNDYFVELDDLVNTTDADCHTEGRTDELDFLDTVPDSQFGDGKFLEIDDIENHAKTDPLGLDMLEEYLLYFDAIDDNPQHVALGSSSILISEDSGQIESTPLHEQVNEGMKQESLQPLETNGAEGASSSKQIRSSTNLNKGAEFDYDDKLDGTLSKRATHMLGLIPPPPAHALGFPAKGQAATNSSGSIHVTAGMIQLTVTCNGKDWSLDKNGDVDFLLSYGWPTTVGVFAGDLLLSNGTDLEPTASNVLGKAWSVMLRSGFHLVFYCVLVLSMTWKIGTCMQTR